MKNRQKDYLHSFHKADRIEILRSGPLFYNVLIQLIDSAKESIHIQMYIINDDEIGNLVLASLINASKRGVDINVVADGFGSRNLSSSFVDKMNQAGIQFRFFSRISLFKNLSIGRRLHHKLVVIDHSQALVGGINIADKYRGTPEKEAWLDFAIWIQGDVCRQLEKICYQIEEKQYSLRRMPEARQRKIDEQVRVSIRQNDFLRNKKQIFESYYDSIRNAEKEILIFGSYFLPGIRLRRALENAAARGVNITIVLAGRSDIPLAINATYYLYHWLHKHNIRIYEWTKSVLHAKLAVIDDHWMTIGSFNLNHLSTYASIELNVDVMNSNFILQTRHTLENIMHEGCVEIQRNRKRPLLTQLREIIAYFLGRTLIKTIAYFPDFRNFYSRMTD